MNMEDLCMAIMNCHKDKRKYSREPDYYTAKDLEESSLYVEELLGEYIERRIKKYLEENNFKIVKE